MFYQIGAIINGEKVLEVKEGRLMVPQTFNYFAANSINDFTFTLEGVL
jgi:hypothetical protein